MTADEQIEMLANYIMANCPFEIEPEDGACRAAARLLDRLSGGIKEALLELGVPGEGYLAPVDNAVKVLTKALGHWGEGTEN